MRDAIANLASSKIREVANSAIGREDVLAFWFGESDEVTPEPIREAAIASLQRGETFYSSNLGLPELREAIARYVGSLHRPCGASRIAVTSSGVSGLMIAMQALAGPGDEVVAVVPVWPNLTAQPAILGARVTRVALVPRAGAWTLDLDALLAAVSEGTRVLLVNAPNNPTGWTMTRAEQQALLDHCRATGTWILADEVYERLYFEAEPAAPSFLDLAEPDDRLVVTNSFSKCFLMTGWRLGWLVLPERLTAAIGTLIEFNTSCAPVFVQRGGLAGLAHADELVRDLRARTQACRDTLIPQLMALPGVELCNPRGGMYAFFRIAGHADSLALAKRFVTLGIGLAPGVAFGDEAEGWLRWCFASRDPARLTRGVERLAAALYSVRGGGP
jgi:aspartate/methionine/tyrosine aminotransferase